MNADMKTKARAHQEVKKALARGDLVRQPCEVGVGCSPRPAVAHHDDYSRPLDVRWLCYRHHVCLHRFGSVHGRQHGIAPEGRAA